MLYTKPIQEITYQDVVNFCNNGYLEGFILEYKSQLPINDDLAKIISALANTYGGLLIIGINAPKGVPVAPFEGITFESSLKYEEKIESICISNIKEPIFPEVHICLNNNNKDKAFIVVRVAESSIAPHRVLNNTRVYIRTGQSSNPLKEADWEKIEWLSNRRKKSIELRKYLKNQAEEYFYSACLLKGVNLKNEDKYFSVLSLKSVPMFPQQALLSYTALENIEEKIRIDGLHLFPVVNLYKPQLVQGGIQKLEIVGENPTESNDGKNFYYIYLNSFGLYLWKEDFGMYGAGTSEEKEKMIKFHRLFIRIYQYLRSAAKFYSFIGFWGNLYFEIQLRSSLGVKFRNPRGANYILDDENGLLKLPISNLNWPREVRQVELSKSVKDFFIPLIHDVAWSLGIHNFNKDEIERMIEANKL